MEKQPIELKPCNIATDAQIDAEKLLSYFLDINKPSLMRQRLHDLFMHFLFDVAAETADLSRENLQAYCDMYDHLCQVEKFAKKYGINLKSERGQNEPR
jgi:hypothetical protein